MPRIPELTPEQMDPDQKTVFDDIMSGPRGSLRGPFHAWLHSPNLADPAQKLGAFCRFSSSLPTRSVDDNSRDFNALHDSSVAYDENSLKPGADLPEPEPVFPRYVEELAEN